MLSTLDDATPANKRKLRRLPVSLRRPQTPVAQNAAPDRACIKTPNPPSRPHAATRPAASTSPLPSSTVARSPASNPASAPPKPPPPAQLITAKDLGSRFGKSQSTVYRWIDEGLIPERFVRYAGRREILISAEAEEVLRNSFREMHE